MRLEGEHIRLRALEPEDLELLYSLENNESIWELSHTQAPFSKYLIKEYLENAYKDIYEVKQLRLVICDKQSEVVLGLVDLFDFDPKNKRVGVGIIIINPVHRNQGIGKEALNLVVDYSFEYLHVRQLYCNIAEHNTASINLFEKTGFKRIGVKKDWNYNGKDYENELLYQLIKDVY